MKPNPPLSVAAVRSQFPGLSRQVGGQPAVFFDGPAGSQVPQRVADAVSRYLLENNANEGGSFVTSRLTVETVEEARSALGTQNRTFRRTNSWWGNTLAHSKAVFLPLLYLHGGYFCVEIVLRK